MFGLAALVFIIVVALARGLSRTADDHRAMEDAKANGRNVYIDPVNPYITRDVKTGKQMKEHVSNQGIKYFTDRHGNICGSSTWSEWEELYNTEKDNPDYTTVCKLIATSCLIKKFDSANGIFEGYAGSPGGFAFRDPKLAADNPYSPDEDLYYRNFWGMDVYVNKKGNIVRYTDEMIDRMNKCKSYEFTNALNISKSEFDKFIVKYNNEVNRRRNLMNENPDEYVTKVRDRLNEEYSRPARTRKDCALEIFKDANSYSQFFYCYHLPFIHSFVLNGKYICKEKEWQKGRFMNMKMYEWSNPSEMEGFPSFLSFSRR